MPHDAPRSKQSGKPGQGHPDYDVPLGIDEEKLQQTLQAEVKYRRPAAREHDVDSVTAIHRLRKGRPQHHIEACEAVFVTTNRSLGWGCARFFREEYPLTIVPYCVLDDVFTTIVWLKNPQNAPDLPRKRIIADCYAALNPPDPLWRQYSDEIDRLQARGDVTDDDYILLRYDVSAHNALMDITLGDRDVFTEGTVADVLERARANVRREAEGRLGSEAGRADAAERRALEASEATERSEARRQADRDARHDQIRYVSTRSARGVVRALGLLLLVPVGIGVFVPLLAVSLPGGVFGALLVSIVVVVGVCGVGNLMWGMSVASLLRWREIWLTSLISRILTALTEPHGSQH